MLRKSDRPRDWTPLFLTLAMLAGWAAMHLLLGTTFWGATAYRTYTLQALAWRDGRLSLWYDFPYLELAIYEGNYFVSFPPLPSVVLLPLTFLFGVDTPDALLVKLYSLSACLLLYSGLKQRGYVKLQGALLSFLLCFASSLLPLTLDGAVWYHAQVLAFFLIIAAIALLMKDQPTWALLCYALSVACRPFDAIYGLPLFFIYIRTYRKDGISWNRTIRNLSPGVCLGLLVALAIGLYNYARFGNPFEFGHNYLPEFSFQGGIQFSLSHVFEHLPIFLWGLPLEMGAQGLQFKQFGYSIFLACPGLLLTMLTFFWDGIRKKWTLEKIVTILTMLLLLFFLLFHRTFGGYQLGARYAVDALPCAFLYLMLSPADKKKGWLWIAFMLPFLALTVLGTLQVHI